MKLAVQKNHLGSQILYRSFYPELYIQISKSRRATLGSGKYLVGYGLKEQLKNLNNFSPPLVAQRDLKTYLQWVWGKNR